MRVERLSDPATNDAPKFRMRDPGHILEGPQVQLERPFQYPSWPWLERLGQRVEGGTK